METPQNSTQCGYDYQRDADRMNATGKENPECPICRDKGLVYVVEDGYLKANFCKCKIKRDTALAIKRSGLSDRMRGCTFDTFTATEQWQKSMKDMAQQFCEENGHWFYIGGQVGCGKTHICTAIMNELLEKGKRCRYMVWPSEVDNIKGNAEDFSAELERFMRVPVLYIDDFLKVANGSVRGERVPPVGELNAAFKLLNHRYNQDHCVTIFSSEHFIDDINGFDDGVGSRIYERCRKYRIEISKDPVRNMRVRT